MYQNLQETLVENGVTPDDLALALGVSRKTIRNKLAGRFDFSWHEIVRLYAWLFPGDRDAPTIDWLFTR